MSANLDPNQQSDVQPPDLLAGNDWLLTDDLQTGSPEDSPLPADANKGAESEELKGADALKVEGEPKTEEQPKVEVQEAAPETPAVDPELAEGDTELLEALPEAARPETTARFKAANFKQRFLSDPGEQTLAHMETLSPSRTGEIKDAVVSQFIAEPAPVLREMATKDPDTADRFVQSVYDGDENYFARKVAGRETDATVTPEYVRTAVEFFEKFKDNIPEAKTFELSAESEERIREEFEDDPAEAERVIAQLKASKGDSPELADLRDKVKRLESGEQTKAEAARLEAETALKKEQDETWDAGYSEIESYVVLKAEKQYKLVPTEDERKHSPMVAALKDIKRKFFLRGDGEELPDFEIGFREWGKPREGFVSTVTRMKHFSDKREKDNTVEVAKSLIRPADKYADERMGLPVFKLLDDLIQLAAKGSNPPPPDVEVPGTNGTGSQAVTDINDWAMNLT